MFAQTLGMRRISSSKSSKNIHNPNQNKSLDLADLQFQLCSNFFKQNKQKLYQQQAELLTSSENFITKVQQRTAFSYMNPKDISKSQDTTTFSFQAGDEEDMFSQSCQSTLILRKSKSTNCMRRTDTDYSSILKQVQNKCSDRISQVITNLIEENKRLKQKGSNIEKKEKQFKKKQVQYEKQQEKIFLLKKKATQYDKIINSLHTEISALKLKLKESEQTLKRSKSPSHDMQFPQIKEIQISLKLFLNQKQQIVVQSSKHLKQLYQEVLTKLQEPFSAKNDACEKCCQMLKRIKDSIMKYRQLMETEANAVEDLYEKYKAKLK